ARSRPTLILTIETQRYESACSRFRQLPSPGCLRRSEPIPRPGGAGRASPPGIAYAAMTVSTRTAHGLCLATGAVGWLAIALTTGRREAWDAEIYFSLFLPALALLVAALSFLHPDGAWRWAFLPFG